jgi:hypothetical protein
MIQYALGSVLAIAMLYLVRCSYRKHQALKELTNTFSEEADETAKPELNKIIRELMADDADVTKAKEYAHKNLIFQPDGLESVSSSVRVVPGRAWLSYDAALAAVKDKLWTRYKVEKICPAVLEGRAWVGIERDKDGSFHDVLTLEFTFKAI